MREAGTTASPTRFGMLLLKYETGGKNWTDLCSTKEKKRGTFVT